MNNRSIKSGKANDARAISQMRSRVSVFLSLLALAITLIGSAQPAMAQAAQGKSPPVSNSRTNEVAAKDITDAYDLRNPYMDAQRKADTHNQTIPGTKFEKSDQGTPQPYPAYTMVYNPYGYFQPPLIGKTNPAQSRDNEISQNSMTTFGMPLSDTQFQMIHRENQQRLQEQIWDPEKMMWMMHATAQMQTAAAGNGMAGVAEQSMTTALDRILNADASYCLINVANENAAGAYAVHAPYRTVPNAVGMVQAMYKQVFVPMAILFLLPGAVMSQVKGQIGRGFSMLGYSEAMNPFEGIMRSIVAVFLIPATQVIISWSIDAGNSMAYSVRDWVDIPVIMDWMRQLSYNTNQKNDLNRIPAQLPTDNAGGNNNNNGGNNGGGGGGGGGGGILGWLNSILNAIFGSIGGGMGIGADQPEGQAVIEQTGALSQILQAGLNFIITMSAMFLVVLSAFQIVLMCYFLLLGPLAASFYAWPQAGQNLFRNVFGSWVEGVITVALWRFYWMVVLAVMTQRLYYTGGATADLQWEIMMLICFLGILLWVPASPFSFSAASAFGSAEDLANKAKEAGSGKGGGGKGGGGGGGGGGSHSNDSHQQQNNNETQTNGQPVDAKKADSASQTPKNDAQTNQVGSLPPGQSSDRKAGDGSGPAQGQNQAQGQNNQAPVASMPPSEQKGANDTGNASSPSGPVGAANQPGANNPMPNNAPPVPLAPQAGAVAVNPNVPQAGSNSGSESGSGDGGDDAGGAKSGAAQGAKGGPNVANVTVQGDSANANVSGAANAAQNSSASGPPLTGKSDDDKGGD